MVSRVAILLLFSQCTDVLCLSASVEPMSVCTLARDFAAYRDKVVTVRGVYLYGLRDTCAAKCADALWPSFVDLSSNTDDFNWGQLSAGLREAYLRSRKGEHVELWVTVVGTLKTNAKPAPSNPCDRIGSGYFGFGHLAAFPAQIKVSEVRDVQVKVSTTARYDYSTVLPARAL